MVTVLVCALQAVDETPFSVFLVPTPAPWKANY